MLKTIKGFSCGTHGACGLNPAKHKVMVGKPGQGRAAALREYTISVQRNSDGKTLERTIGPGYLSKNKWRDWAQKVQAELIKELS